MLFVAYQYLDPSYYAYDENYLIGGITEDHICSSRQEKFIVGSLSKDPNPLRPSINDTVFKFPRFFYFHIALIITNNLCTY